jgi:D-sedoheptulose 7-phosphate isomerase
VTRDTIKQSLIDAERSLEAMLADENILKQIELFAEALAEAFGSGHRVYAAGNGGSHCDAMHFAEEWTGRYRKDRKPMPAMALGDPSHITCTSNDYGFEHIFERMIDAFGREGDLFLAISTSGNSKNIIRAARTAKARGMIVVGLMGKDGGELRSLCDIPIIVPGATTDRIQELHIKVIHIVIECVERKLFPELYQ